MDRNFTPKWTKIAPDRGTYRSIFKWGAPDGFNVAYFSAEFGEHESMSIYSGGLGVLAGDFLKSASDLGMPLVGVGLLYREGYHTQFLNADGWQQERYPRNDFVMHIAHGVAHPRQRLLDIVGSVDHVEVTMGNDFGLQ